MPPEVESVISDPSVVEAMVGVVIAGLGVIGGLLGWAVKRLNAVQKKVVATNEQVTNNHDTNLRDDVTEIKDLMAKGFQRMDHQFGETHDRIERLDRDRQALSDRVDEDRKLMMKFHESD